MRTWNIQGSCEHCKAAYKGIINYGELPFPAIRCPNCHEETEEFDEAYIVERSDKDMPILEMVS